MADKTRIHVKLGARSYAVMVTDSYDQLPSWLSALALPRQGWIVSHQAVLARHGRALMDPLTRAGWSLDVITIPAAETSKSLAIAEQIMRRLARKDTMQPAWLLAFGGGVVGDVAGFVASVYRRGIPYVQIPTTLLAQVDSALGGKVAVDLPYGKNLVGAFYQPRLVCNNVSVLQTLPMRQRRSGLAEIIKYGVIADRAFFALLRRRMAACLRLEPHILRRIIHRSCAIKARVVSADERETGQLRASLNFGHTIGHALETATRYRRWTHGEAIAIGMCAAARLGVEVGCCREAVWRHVEAVVLSAGLPIRATQVSRTLVRQALRRDKKFIHGRPRWVLPKEIGRVIVTEDVPERAVDRVLDHYVQ